MLIKSDSKEKTRHQSLANARLGSNLDMTDKKEMDSARRIEKSKDKDELRYSSASKDSDIKLRHLQSDPKRFDVKILKVAGDVTPPPDVPHAPANQSNRVYQTS